MNDTTANYLRQQHQGDIEWQIKFDHWLAKDRKKIPPYFVFGDGRVFNVIHLLDMYPANDGWVVKFSDNVPQHMSVYECIIVRNKMRELGLIDG